MDTVFKNSDINITVTCLISFFSSGPGNKVKRTELPLVQALVAPSAARLGEVLAPMIRGRAPMARG
jgi:hypothetical protein